MKFLYSDWDFLNSTVVVGLVSNQNTFHGYELARKEATYE